MRAMTVMVAMVATAAMAQDPMASNSDGDRRTYFFQAQLAKADLRQADLRKAHLSQANMAGADLRGANLEGAYMRKTDLRNADLRGAKFSTRLKGAELASTRLEGAVYDAATVLPFDDAKAKALGMVKAEGVASPVETQLEGALAQK
jgi:uncharacterized protein YjbI with pentapeptide repeats